MALIVIGIFGGWALLASIRHAAYVTTLDQARMNLRRNYLRRVSQLRWRSPGGVGQGEWGEN